MGNGIVRVEIPENCRECDLRTIEGYCIPAHKDIFLFGVRGGKPAWCPIKEIKDGDKDDGA